MFKSKLFFFSLALVLILNIPLSFAQSARHGGFGGGGYGGGYGGGHGGAQDSLNWELQNKIDKIRFIMQGHALEFLDMRSKSMMSADLDRMIMALERADQNSGGGNYPGQNNGGGNYPGQGGGVQTSYYFCSLNTPFDGIFSGKALSKEEALTMAIMACKNVAGSSSIFCAREKVVCDRAN